MPNVKQLIDGHNRAILNNNGIAQPRQDEEKKCNCRKKEECPLNGECLVNEVVYQATVKTKDTNNSLRPTTRSARRQKRSLPTTDPPTAKELQHRR